MARRLESSSTVPAGLEVDEALIQRDLNRRRVGQSRVTSPRNEADKVQILSGVFEGRTTGTPISIIAYNRTPTPANTTTSVTCFGPATPTTPTAPNTACATTAAAGAPVRAKPGAGGCRRDGAGAVATAGIDVYAFTAQIGTIRAETFERGDRLKPRACRGPRAAERMVAAIDQISWRKTAWAASSRRAPRGAARPGRADSRKLDACRPGDAEHTGRQGGRDRHRIRGRSNARLAT